MLKKYLQNFDKTHYCNQEESKWQNQLTLNAKLKTALLHFSDFSQSPYHTNKEVYRILKYGLKLAEHPGQSPKTVYFINWEEPEKNNFYITEACRYYEIFQEKNFKNCAIVSSYMPDWKDRKNLLNELILDCYKE